ncbi:peptidoglycan DD-metalloendopeptidase family protein [Achromobacter animicus]|uniref:peptidoglycan DD-metalloendopeptidase family protein n=1 Tax=Achromobacter animicus TaxID=1389935 RepID=UPI0028A73A8A|nr:peptidoglycan DD-metalloendopeptidase family protein [Achromobacter animicus]
MVDRRDVLRAGLAAAVLCLAWPARAQQASYITRKLDARVPGGVAVLSLGDGAAAPQVTYLGRPVLVVREAGKQWIAVVGIPLTVKPGQEQVQVKDGGGTRQVAFTVGAKDYVAQHITLKNRRQVDPNPDDLKRIERELAEQVEAYRGFRAGVTPSNLILDRPVDGGRLSSPFGLRRFFNGQERNPHSGLDFAVPAGTPIKAPAAGVVVLVGDYFFNGKTVFLDHGQGFVSMFCHMSAISVKVGDEVPRGGVVGKVGATGRATGPHLHWNVSLNDARIDPAIFIGAFKP